MTNRIIRILSFSLGAVFLLGIGGCGESHSYRAVEDMQNTAKSNGEVNAINYRDKNYPQYAIYVRGDSTISDNCLNGDGWVSVDLRDPKTNVVRKELKCSSFSASIGCMSKSDFDSRPQYADEEGKCNKAVPLPIPKLKS